MNKESPKLTKLRLLQLLQLTAIIELTKVCDQLNLKYYGIAGTLLGAFRHKGFIPWDTDADFAMFRSDYNKLISMGNNVIDKKFVIQSDYNDINNKTCFARIRIKSTYFVEKENECNPLFSGLYIDIFPLDNAAKRPSLFSLMHHKILKIFIRVKAYRLGKKNSSTSIRSFLAKLLNYSFFFIPLSLIKSYLDFYMTKHNGYETNLVTNYNSKYGLKKQTIPRKIYGNPKYKFFEGVQIPIPEHSEFWLKRIYGDYNTPLKVSSLELSDLLSGYDLDFGDYNYLLSKTEQEARKILDLV